MLPGLVFDNEYTLHVFHRLEQGEGRRGQVFSQSQVHRQAVALKGGHTVHKNICQKVVEPNEIAEHVR